MKNLIKNFFIKALLVLLIVGFHQVSFGIPGDTGYITRIVRCPYVWQYVVRCDYCPGGAGGGMYTCLCQASDQDLCDSGGGLE